MKLKITDVQKINYFPATSEMLKTRIEACRRKQKANRVGNRECVRNPREDRLIPPGSALKGQSEKGKRRKNN